MMAIFGGRDGVKIDTKQNGDILHFIEMQNVPIFLAR